MGLYMEKIFIIAEAGVNHNGSLAMAKQLIDAAVNAKADAVKFQTFCTEDLVSKNAPKAEYQSKKTTNHESQYEMLKSLELTEDAQKELQLYCKKRCILFLSSPFDLKSLHFLHDTLNVPIIKIASGEITHLPLLLRSAQTGKKIILSTGMSSLGEIETALAILAFGYLNSTETFYPSINVCLDFFYSDEGQFILAEKVSLLHCTSEYPAPFDEINLRALRTLHLAFGLPLGYSDHTVGTAISMAAVACGAKIIEKHFTLYKKLPGPDHTASLDPDELSALVTGIRQVEQALGHSKKIPTLSEMKNRLIARKSLVAITKIQCGDLLTEQNMGSKRPGHGISPLYFDQMKDTRADRDYEPDELLTLK